MFFRKKEERYNNLAQSPYPQAMPSNLYNFQEVIPNNYDINRLQTEINELKRLNNEMLKRISRIENYLGIRGGEN